MKIDKVSPINLFFYFYKFLINSEEKTLALNKKKFVLFFLERKKIIENKYKKWSSQ